MNKRITPKCLSGKKSINYITFKKIKISIPKIKELD